MFHAVCASPEQRVQRGVEVCALSLKYLAGGVACLWPIVIVLLALVVSPRPSWPLAYLAALSPGLGLWAYVYVRGAREEYGGRVRGRILRRGFLRELLLP